MNFDIYVVSPNKSTQPKNESIYINLLHISHKLLKWLYMGCSETGKLWFSKCFNLFQIILAGKYGKNDMIND